MFYFIGLMLINAYKSSKSKLITDSAEYIKWKGTVKMIESICSKCALLRQYPFIHVVDMHVVKDWKLYCFHLLVRITKSSLYQFFPCWKKMKPPNKSHEITIITKWIPIYVYISFLWIDFHHITKSKRKVWMPCVHLALHLKVKVHLLFNQ